MLLHTSIQPKTNYRGTYLGSIFKIEDIGKIGVDLISFK